MIYRKNTVVRSLAGVLSVLLAMGSVLTSCGGHGETNLQSESTDKSQTSEQTAESQYEYPELDMNGETFTILNAAQPYQFYSALDMSEISGDTLDDSIYERNRKLEDMFRFKLEVNEEYEMENAAASLQTAVLAGDDLYDVAFIRDYYMASALTEGYVQNLDDIPELRLDEKWWDSDAIENARVGKKHKALFAMSDISLVDFEGTVVTFFNEDMMSKLGLEAPYQLVREGKWVFDELLRYMKAGADLNGDESFDFNESGNSVYGMAGWQHAYNALITSAGVQYVTKNSDGDLMFGIDNEKFYNMAIKLSQAFAEDGVYIYANKTGITHYETLFKQNRSFFMIAQLKAANKYRDMEANYGIVPIPKSDESQTNYRNLRTFTYVMSVPVTNTEPSKAGCIMDAMAYITYKDIMPYFYSGRVSQKSLRNDDSIEMLEIIRDSRYLDLGTAYGSFTDVSNSIADVINQKSTDFVSLVAKIKPGIEEHLRKIMEAVNG